MNEIIELIRTTLLLPPNQLDESTKLESVIKDSMDIVELIAVLSDKYKVAIDPGKMKDISTIGDIAEYVEQNKNTKGQGSPMETF